MSCEVLRLQQDEKARFNVQIEVTERLNRAGIECATGGNAKAEEGFEIALSWSAGRKLLRALRLNGIGNP